YVTFITESYGAGLSLGKAIDEYSYMTFKYDFSNIKTSKVNPLNVSPFLYNGTNVSSSISPMYVIDKRDSKRKPTEGYNIRTGGEFAGLGGDKYYKLSLQTGYYYPFTSKIIGHLMGTAGYGNSYGGDVLKSYARYIGNGRLLRGYRYDDLGPKDSAGGVVGGNSELYFNFEVHYVYNDMLRPYIFYDRGNVYGSGFNLRGTNKTMSLTEMRQSYGIGLLVDTPIGPVNVNYGIKISPLPGERGGQFNFGLGGLF
ncbi:MAG: BamA/TamA family outer membrane protein, partial [Nitrospinae bacterium]|nr:BamA/TamA family outer membrane protein [Nitrospinota bacterium]